MKELGERLRESRMRKNLSLREAAEMIGVSHTYLNSLEKGQHPKTGRPVNPSAKMLQRISEGYGIPLEELLMKDDSEKEKDTYDIEAITSNVQHLSPEDRDVILYLIRRLRDD